VQPGETLSGIAARYGLSVAEIADQNDIGNPNLIFAGQSLRIGAAVEAPAPAPTGWTTYLVKEGDSLSVIAERHGVPMAAIADASAIANPEYILVGQVLRIPRAEAAGTIVSREVAEAALRDAELEFGLPVGLLRALAWQESGWQQHVVSGAGAVGLTQLLPSTAEWVVEFLLGEPLNWKTDARANARVGAAFLRHLINRAQGDLRLALASYYQGWSSVERYGLYDETRQYVENVLFLAESY
jgi:N-acetylmuramoyl-L-alanine amidase